MAYVNQGKRKPPDVGSVPPLRVDVLSHVSPYRQRFTRVSVSCPLFSETNRTELSHVLHFTCEQGGQLFILLLYIRPNVSPAILSS